MSLCVCGHFQLRENFYWVPARFYFLESSQQSFHLRVTVIPILQRRRLRLRGVGYLSEITKHVRGPVTQSCLTPQHMCLTLCCAEPIPEGARASHELEQVAWPLLFYPRLCILTFTKKRKKKKFFFKWKYQSLFLAVSYNSLYVVFSSSFRKSFLSGGGEACSLY